MKHSAHRALLLVLVASALVVTAACGSDSDSSTSSGSSSSTTSTTTTPSTGQLDTAVWPFSSSDTRYTAPEQAAEGFAVDFLGFVDPVMGPFAAGDSRSGEVTVQPTASGPVTTVAVRQLTSDDTWWVLAASTPNLQLEAPTSDATITTPVTLSGRSTAFEGTVSVQIRESGTVAPVGTDFVTGGANGEMGPFSKAISYAEPTAASGAIVLQTLGGENGVVWEASVTRVRFG